jgi:hypothetical protein
MSAVIMVDLDRVHPVFDGRWHRARLHQLPQPGEDITTLCGRVETVEYRATKEQTVTVLTCWPCDLAYRRQEGVAVLPTHPALTGMVPPKPRRGLEQP